MIDKQTIFELARKAGCDIDGDIEVEIAEIEAGRLVEIELGGYCE